MGAFKVYVAPEVERRFREAAMRTYGFGRGSLSRAAQQAMEHWAAQNELPLDDEDDEPIEDPVEAIMGLLKHVKGKSGVQLQKETHRARAERTMAHRNVSPRRERSPRS